MNSMSTPASVRPELSIIIPVLNRPKPLACLVAQLDAQAAIRPDAVELIIVDDGSRPPIAPIDTTALPLRLLHHDRRRGANAARATGLAAARGTFVHFHDSDDGIAANWLGAVLTGLNGPSRDADILVTRRWNDQKGRLVETRQRWLERYAHDVDRVRRMLAVRNCFGPMGGLIFSRRALSGVGFPNLASSQDWAICLNALHRPVRIAVAPDIHFIHRLDGHDRISHSPRAKLLGLFGIVRMTADATPFGTYLRYYHLQRFKWAVHALNRPSLRRLWRHSRFSRRFWHAAVTMYAVLWLGLR